MPFILRTNTGVPKATAQRVARWLAALSEVTKVEHPVPVIVFADPALPPGSDLDYGTFIYWQRRDCRIELAGKATADSLKETLCHEVAHYEQWRDKRDVNERGIEKRTEELLAEIESPAVTTASSRRPSKAKPAGGSVRRARRGKA